MLTDAAWEELRAILKRHVPAAEVWAYGSRVTGTGHAGSDLDLVVRNPQNPARYTPELMALKSALRESNLPILVDVQDWALLPASFRREIERAFVRIRTP